MLREFDSFFFLVISQTTITGGNTTGERTPSLTINTSNAVRSTMTWLSRENDGNGGYRHSVPITSTISVQQYHPHPTSSRPFINSAINNSKFNKNSNSNNNKNFNNNNFNHSNNAPSHKPTKKTSKCSCGVCCFGRLSISHLPPIYTVTNCILTDFPFQF